MERAFSVAGILLCKIWKKPLKISALWGKTRTDVIDKYFLNV